MTSSLVHLSRFVAPAEPTADLRISDAREQLDHWSHRASELPWHRRSARREARRMVARSRAQLIAAHLDRTALAPLSRRATPLLDTHGRSAGRHARRLAWTVLRSNPLGRRFIAGAAAVAGAGLVAFAGIGALATHLLGLWG
jgi:hypothetical protein